MKCSHNKDHMVWIGKDKKVYLQCQKCGHTISPTVDFERHTPLPADYVPKLTLIAMTVMHYEDFIKRKNRYENAAY